MIMQPLWRWQGGQKTSEWECWLISTWVTSGQTLPTRLNPRHGKICLTPNWRLHCTTTWKTRWTTLRRQALFLKWFRLAMRYPRAYFMMMARLATEMRIFPILPDSWNLRLLVLEHPLHPIPKSSCIWIWEVRTLSIHGSLADCWRPPPIWTLMCLAFPIIRCGTGPWRACSIT